MPNLMERGATWLAGKLQTAAGVTVTYQQGTRSTPDLTAWISEMEIEVLQDGAPTIVKAFAWNFLTEDLADNEITPRSGDRIVAGSVVYEAMPIADAKPVKDELDTSGKITQVLTKRIRNG